SHHYFNAGWRYRRELGARSGSADHPRGWRPTPRLRSFRRRVSRCSARALPARAVAKNFCGKYRYRLLRQVGVDEIGEFRNQFTSGRPARPCRDYATATIKVAHVRGPTIPSATRPWARWNRLTAASVLASKSPVAETATFVWPSWTTSPLAPRRSVGRLSASTAGITDGSGAAPPMIAEILRRKSSMSNVGSIFRPTGKAYSLWPQHMIES